MASRWRLPVVRIALVAMLLALIDGFAIEPYWPYVDHREASIAGLASPITIAHLSDLHTKGFGRLEARVAAILDREKPDLIVITGDVIAGNNRDPSFRGMEDTLRRLHAPLGVWIVPGNWDHWTGGGHEYERMAAAGAQLLVNRAAKVRDDLWLAGFDDALSGSPDVRGTLAQLPPNVAAIGLFHSPVLFDALAGTLPLMLAGHTHGGQVRLPFYGPLIRPPMSGSYDSGWYERAGSRMYVSRGIGTSVIPVRFDCRPEVTILRVTPR